MRRFLRKVLRASSQRFVFKRRLPSAFSRRPLYVSSKAALRWLRPGDGAFDALLLEIAKRFAREGDTIWDVGSNVGEFTVAAADTVGGSGMVLSVEPDTWLCQLIRRSMQHQKNESLKINLLSSAISSRSGVATLVIPRRGRASNALKRSGRHQEKNQHLAEYLVPTLRLDDLLAASSSPDLIKIDVEGEELDVLKGGQDVLRKHRPLIYVEITKDSRKRAQVLSLLKRYEYEFWNPYWSIRTGQATRGVAFNTLACPAEKTVQQSFNMP